MLEKYLAYLNETFTAVEYEYGKDYLLRTIPDKFRVLFAKMVEKNKLQWKVETHQINIFQKGLTDEQIEKVKERAREIKEAYAGPFPYEDIPDWYYDFMKIFSGMGIVRANIMLDSGFEAAENTIEMKPESLDGLFYIGQYDQVRTSPIFTNEEGNVFVFRAKEFRSYDDMAPTDKNLKKYRKTEVPLIAYWESIEEFLLSETKRLLDLYLTSPKYSAPDSIVPYNVTPELLKALRQSGKIK